MAEESLPPGVRPEEESLPPGVRSLDLATIGGQMLRNAQRELPSASLGDMGKAAVMPIAGAVLGRKFGGMAGEGIGSAIGTAGNMAAGLQPRSLWDLGQSAVAPLAGRTIGGIARQGMMTGARQLPGYAAAGHELASVKVKSIPDMVRPGTPHGTLYDQLRQMPEIVVDTRNINKAAQDILAADARASKLGLHSPPTKEIAEGVRDATSPKQVVTKSALVDERGRPFPATVTELPPGPITFNEYWDGLKRIGQKVDAYQKTGGEALGASKILYREALKDLEAAGERFPALKSANEAFKKGLAADELNEVITNKVITPTSNGLLQIQPQILRKWLSNTNNADTVKNLSKEDVAGIHKILTLAERLPRLPPPEGQAHGSGAKIATGAWGTLFGGAAGGAMGGLPGAGVGAAVMTPAFIAANSIVTKALTSNIGRKALMKVMDRGPFLDHAAIAALAVAINAGAKAQPSAME